MILKPKWRGSRSTACAFATTLWSSTVASSCSSPGRRGSPLSWRSGIDHGGIVMSDDATPDRILQLGFGFWGPKVLLSAVELGVFSELAKSPRQDAAHLSAKLGL